MFSDGDLLRGGALPRRMTMPGRAYRNAGTGGRRSRRFAVLLAARSRRRGDSSEPPRRRRAGDATRPRPRRAPRRSREGADNCRQAAKTSSTEAEGREHTFSSREPGGQARRGQIRVAHLIFKKIGHWGGRRCSKSLKAKETTESPEASQGNRQSEEREDEKSSGGVKTCSPLSRFKLREQSC